LPDIRIEPDYLRLGFIDVTARRDYDTRTGFEDTLTLPDGSRVESNAALVSAAFRIVAQAAPVRS
jgi:uncharacterized protein (DUF849 family)